MDGWLLPVLVLLGSYLLGSVPFGLIVARLGNAPDPRTIGSGNIGATNVLRTGRKGLAALTLLLDGGKGVMAVFGAEALAPGCGPLAAVGAFYGHIFPPWLRFNGGKGVAILLGLALALCWPAGLIALAIWLAAVLVSRFSSVGGMAAAVAVPVAAGFYGRPDLSLIFLAFALTVLWRHRGNIERLLQGTEPRVGRSTIA